MKLWWIYVNLYFDIIWYYSIVVSISTDIFGLSRSFPLQEQFDELGRQQGWTHRASGAFGWVDCTFYLHRAEGVVVGIFDDVLSYWIILIYLTSFKCSTLPSSATLGYAKWKEFTSFLGLTAKVPLRPIVSAGELRFLSASELGITGSFSVFDPAVNIQNMDPAWSSKSQHPNKIWIFFLSTSPVQNRIEVGQLWVDSPWFTIDSPAQWLPQVGLRHRRVKGLETPEMRLPRCCRSFGTLEKPVEKWRESNIGTHITETDRDTTLCHIPWHNNYHWSMKLAERHAGGERWLWPQHDVSFPVPKVHRSLMKLPRSKWLGHVESQSHWR